MSDPLSTTFESAHLHFAKASNGQVWELLQQPERSKSQNDLMLAAAYASAYHWLQAGTALNQ